MDIMKLQEKLLRYTEAGTPILYIHSFEEEKTDRMIAHVAHKTQRIEIVEWNGTQYVVDFETKTKKFPNTLQAVLEGFMEDSNRKILLLKDLPAFLDDPVAVAMLKELAVQIGKGQADATIVIVSSVIRIPHELEKYTIVLEMEHLEQAEIQDLIHAFCSEQKIVIPAALLDTMSVMFKGLSEFEIGQILATAYADDGEITKQDLGLIFEQKQQMIKKAGILEMVPQKEGIEDIGGLENLKAWLQRKAKIFADLSAAQSFGVDIPKGVLIAGAPGCGKSLCAKAAAKLFGVPLLRLDMGRIMGKYVGESESNMRNAINLAEAIAPCVLWIDELEKAFSGIGGNGGTAEVTTRLLATFLTWLQEKESATFIVATANDITKLPPELLRKGRFDEIFYVGLPQKEERKKILQIHIAKRRNADLAAIDLDKLVANTEGYSGADIEGVVKESIETTFIGSAQALTTDAVLQAIKGTTSLSEIMKEPLLQMKKEYEARKLKSASL